MKKIYMILVLFLTIGMTGCEKEYGQFYKDNLPETPVTFPGTTTYGFNPYISMSIADLNAPLKFTLAIPDNSPRSIKEITKVLGGATAIQPGGVANAKYITTPIAGNGKTAVFQTTLAAFKASSEANSKLVVANGEIAFMFLVTLDNGETIIPVQVRVRLTA
ncbi:hypothetical protein [Pedobacter steynii]|uniref:DUF4843 domain-containing protein n=1 Tax=Pedobacter steynii TaxID=430522 RepID=A0A1D7QCT2_9SPHI|nr:hypothetical protein [Pedobacter steynii]AOM76511.1 hypothetical protein BFS30_04685 [Pedobacter steynii]